MPGRRLRQVEFFKSKKKQVGAAGKGKIRKGDVFLNPTPARRRHSSGYARLTRQVKFNQATQAHLPVAIRWNFLQADYTPG